MSLISILLLNAMASRLSVIGPSKIRTPDKNKLSICVSNKALIGYNFDKRHALKKRHKTNEMAANNIKMGWNCNSDENNRDKYN